MKITLLILLAISLVACKQKIGSDLEGLDSFTVKIHQRSGDMQQFEVKVGSENFESMKYWLSTNEDGWTKSFASYVPSVIVSYQATEINFINEIVVLNNKNGQYSKTTTKADYGFLLQ